jgi:hypothetical protein
LGFPVGSGALPSPLSRHIKKNPGNLGYLYVILQIAI